MNLKRHSRRMACILLALCLSVGALASCAQHGDEVPDGYQYATCDGEYFRLFVPTQWTVNTESGISGAYISALDQTAVSMIEVPFDLGGATLSRESDTEDDSSAESGSATETDGETATEDDSAVPGASDRTATLDDFYAAHIAELEHMTDFTLEESKDSTVNGSEGGKRARAKDIIFAATMGGVPYRYRQVLCKVEGRFYIFTYSSTAASFEQWSSIVSEIIENIVFHSVPYVGDGDGKNIPAVDDVPAGMKLVSTNDVAYRVFAPEDWIAVPGSAAAQVYVSEEDRSNVSTIGYVPDTDSFSVADYWEMTEEGYRDGLEDYTLLSATEGETMGGRNATVYEYTYSVGGVDYRARQVVCIYSYMVVTQTYTALPDHYDAHVEDAKAMQAALTFRKPIVG